MSLDFDNEFVASFILGLKINHQSCLITKNMKSSNTT